MLKIYILLLTFAVGAAMIFSDLSYFKKLVGLNIIQIATIILYLTISYTQGCFLPYYSEGVNSYITPLPQVLMLTAIVVGFATFALGVTLCYKLEQKQS